MKHLVTTIALCAATAAHAEFMDGHKLLELFNGSEAQEVLAMGYVAGVHDAGRSAVHCSPDNIKLGELSEMTKMWLRTTRNLDETADILVSTMLKQVFPCENQPQRNRSWPL